MAKMALTKGYKKEVVTKIFERGLKLCTYKYFAPEDGWRESGRLKLYLTIENFENLASNEFNVSQSLKGVLTQYKPSVFFV